MTDIVDRLRAARKSETHLNAFAYESVVIAICMEAADTIERLRQGDTYFHWQEIDAAPWAEWVLVYRPTAPAQRMFATDIRYETRPDRVWVNSRPGEMPALWCYPVIRRNDPQKVTKP